jgi:hypothetical protein
MDRKCGSGGARVDKNRRICKLHPCTRIVRPAPCFRPAQLFGTSSAIRLCLARAGAESALICALRFLVQCGGRRRTSCHQRKKTGSEPAPTRSGTGRAGRTVSTRSIGRKRAGNLNPKIPDLPGPRQSPLRPTTRRVAQPARAVPVDFPARKAVPRHLRPHPQAAAKAATRAVARVLARAAPRVLLVRPALRRHRHRRPGRPDGQLGGARRDLVRASARRTIPAGGPAGGSTSPSGPSRN